MGLLGTISSISNLSKFGLKALKDAYDKNKISTKSPTLEQSPAYKSSSTSKSSSYSNNDISRYLSPTGAGYLDESGIPVAEGTPGSTYYHGDIYPDNSSNNHINFNSGLLAEENPYTIAQPQTQQPIIAQPNDTNKYINELKNAQKAARIAALDKAKSNALSNLDNSFTSSLSALDKEGSAIAPTYYDARNRAAAQSDIGAMNFAQYMASRGIKGAAGGMPEMYRQAGLQGQIGALDRQESADKSDIERRRTEAQKIYDTNKLGIDNAYEADLANANADIDANALQTLIEQMNADRMFNMQKANADREYDFNKQQYQDALTQRNRENYESTAGQYAADYQAQINKVLGDDDPTNDWQADILGNLRAQKIAQQQAGQAAAEEKARTLVTAEEKQRWDNALNLWKTLGVANQEIASILGVSVGAKTADYNLDSMKTDYAVNKPYYNPDSGTSEKGNLTYKDVYNSALGMLGKKDAFGMPVYTPDQIKGSVLYSGLSNEKITQILNALGI